MAQQIAGFSLILYFWEKNSAGANNILVTQVAPAVYSVCMSKHFLQCDFAPDPSHISWDINNLYF